VHLYPFCAADSGPDRLWIAVAAVEGGGLIYGGSRGGPGAAYAALRARQAEMEERAQRDAAESALRAENLGRGVFLRKGAQHEAAELALRTHAWRSTR